MKIKDVWYFNCKQNKNEFLQPDFFTTSSHIGLYCEFNKPIFPLTVLVKAYCNEKLVFENNVYIPDNKCSEKFYIKSTETTALIKINETHNCYPDRIYVSCVSDSQSYEFNKKCEYSILSGKSTDFDGTPFPSAVILYRYGFEDGPFIIGAWTDKNGNYSLKVPNGLYNALYADDNSYGKSSLECWGWHLIIDNNETINLKIGSGEVYSLNVFTDNGGIKNIFLTFRPMIYYKKNEYDISVGNHKFNVTDIAPELEIEDVSVTINGKNCNVISIQKIYETYEDSYAMPMYIVQVPKLTDTDLSDKQTVILDYDTKKRLPNRASSRGFTQFYYKDGLATALK